MTAMVDAPALHSLPLLARGKVRDVYAVGSDRLLMVASDRLSAFDVVMKAPVPGKGALLTQMALFWFEQLRDLMPNHLTGDAPESVVAADEVARVVGRSMLVKRLQPLPCEAVVRGYIAGSGWKEYGARGTVCGQRLPAGLSMTTPLTEPIFTPATKAAVGDHDENISFAQLQTLLGAARAAEVRDAAIRVYRAAAAFALTRGIVIADTKFEFGLDQRGTLTLMDEVLTPDSSRFWLADELRAGRIVGLDKQPLRDWLASTGVTGGAEQAALDLPQDVIDGVMARYQRAQQLLCGDEGKPAERRAGIGHEVATSRPHPAADHTGGRPTHTPGEGLQAHRFVGQQQGVRLIVTGAVHGNEVAGTRGIERVLGEIERGELFITHGIVTFVPVCNPLAYVRGQRNGDRNLNRRLQPTAEPQDNEDRIANALCPLLAQHEVLLDLHSFRGAGRAFVMRGPADNTGAVEPFSLSEREALLAAHVGPNRVVDGWMAAYAAGVARRRAAGLTPGAVHEDPSYGVGTTEYMRSVGGYGVTLECGQHDDPAAPDVAHHAIHQTLALLGMTQGQKPGQGPALLQPARPFECLTLAEVIDRHAEGDRFAREWHSFDPLAEGELIAVRADGTELRAPEAGHIVFPDVSARPGHEWFYRAHKSVRPI